MTQDAVTSTGLTTQSLSDLVTSLTTSMQNIYGSDINVASNSPDGQLINIFAQAGIDIRELAAQVYNSFDPDQAQGTVLDQRVAINNIQRAGGTYTEQPIDITCSTSVTLQGLDANFNNPNGTGYTVSDNSGNQFILINSVTLSSGTTTVNFRAQQIGAVQTVPNTINNMVTVVLGVTSVNNSGAAISIGQNEETDAQLRLRRQQSVAIAASGYLNGLLGTVLGLTGVTQAVLYENVTNSTDANGIPAHGIWLIVEGGSSADIANAIYDKKSFGANMKGSVTYNITTASGAIFQASWDTPVAQTLYVKFNLKKIVSTTVFNTTAIAQNIAANAAFTIGQAADTGTITKLALNAVAANGGGGLVLDVFISLDNITWTDFLATSTLSGQWTLASTNIAITVE